MEAYGRLKYRALEVYGMPYEGWKTVALPEATYAKLEVKAKKEKRSVSNMALLIIEEGLKE